MILLYLAQSIVLAVALAGCASQPIRAARVSEPQAAATPIPYVQHCGVLNTGTPSKFVCNGKVYTSFQLAKIREDQARKYAGGR